MNFEHLESLESKDEVIEYAASLGLEGLTKQTGLVKLKEQVKEHFLLGSLEEETPSESVALAPVAGGNSYTIKLKGEVVTTIPVGSLEQWCKENNFPYATAEFLVGKSWVNHNGYTIE